jgi:hypothetical protein
MTYFINYDWETEKDDVMKLVNVFKVQGITTQNGSILDINLLEVSRHITYVNNHLYRGSAIITENTDVYNFWVYDGSHEILTVTEALRKFTPTCNTCGSVLDEHINKWNDNLYCNECFSTLTDVCTECGEEHPVSELVTFEGSVYCENCIDEVTCICEHCRQRVYNDDSYYFDNKIWCNTCYEENVIECRNCGREEYRENCFEVNGDDYCEECYNDIFYTCDRCGRNLNRDYDEYYWQGDFCYCEYCYDNYINQAINDYSYKPEPIFYGDNSKLFMGVELEIDGGGEDSEKAEQLLNLANDKNTHIYCKHDGSLNDGFEIVSHPMTMKYHKKEMMWNDLLLEARFLGYTSHQAETCGLHIHVSRNFFGSSSYTQDENIGKVLHFMELHWNELLKFSRRTESQLNQWASRYGIGTGCKDTYEKAKYSHKGRYAALNLENRNTIEFRLFRGTLKYNTFMATLQLVDKICKHCCGLSEHEIELETWGDFVSCLDTVEHCELIKYLKSKNLYINLEEMNESEEV